MSVWGEGGEKLGHLLVAIVGVKEWNHGSLF